MKSILPVLKYLKRHTKKIIAYFIFNLISVLFSLVSLTMLIPFLSLIFGQTELVYDKPAFSFSADAIAANFNYYLSQIIIYQGKISALGFICLTVIAAIFIKNFFYYLSKWVNSPIRNGVINDMRSDLYSKVLRLPVGYFSEERKGDLLSRMTNDLQEVEESIISVLDTAIREPLTILIFMGALVKLSPRLTLFLLILLPVTGFVIGRVSKSLKKKSFAGQSKLGDLLSIMEETLAGIRIVKAFNAGGQRMKSFEKENDELFRIKNSINRRRDLASPMSEFLGIVVLCVVLYFGGRMALAEPPVVSPNVFIAYIAIFSQIISPLKSFSTAAYNIQKGSASADRIRQIIDTTETIVDKPNAMPVSEFKDRIVFSKVGFGYREDGILKDINLTIKKGQMVAIVGASGAGKSTLADLIPRFHDVKTGEITLDGINIKEYKLQDLRSLMGIVTQEAILFNDTIFNNIALGKPDTSEEQVRRAGQIASADAFIMDKKEEYHTSIGDRGNLLSGGEKQRLTIARAVLKNPPILILDEATSSLDTESERFVQEAIDKLMQNRTTVVIAHRLSTIQNADEIVVLDKGRIVERGKHEDLILKEGGYYKKLVRMQEFK